jgi:hypothetical protein
MFRHSFTAKLLAMRKGWHPKENMKEISVFPLYQKRAILSIYLKLAQQ